MTALTAAPPPPPGTIERLRTRRDGTGQRVYHGTELLGLVAQRRTVHRGRRCNRWYATPAAMAYTRGVIGQRAPENARAGVEIDEPCTSKHAALVLLLTHLRVTGAPAVAPLYAGTHA